MIEYLKSWVLLPFAGVNVTWVVVLLVVLLLFAYAVTRVSRGGSALTAAERKAAANAMRPQFILRRLLERFIPFAIPVACAACLFSFSQEKVAVLRSRAYTNQQSWDREWKAADLQIKPDAEVIDLGVVVDKALQALDSEGAAKWSIPSTAAGHHQAISRAVLEALDHSKSAMIHWPNVSDRQETTLPLWLVESVERMTMDAIRLRKNVGQIVLQYECRKAGGAEAWGSRSALAAELKISSRKITRMKEPLLVPVLPLPHLRLIHAEAVAGTPDLMVSFLEEDAGGAEAAERTQQAYITLDNGPKPSPLNVSFRPGQVVTIALPGAGTAQVVEQQTGPDGYGLGPIAVSRHALDPRQISLPVPKDLPLEWSERLKVSIATGRDWLVDWRESLSETYGIQLESLLSSCQGPANAVPAPPPGSPIAVLEAMPGSSRGARSLHGMLAAVNPATLGEASQRTTVISAFPVAADFRTGLLRGTAASQPYLTTSPGGTQLDSPFPPRAVEGIDRDLAAATLTSLFLAQARTIGPRVPPAAALGSGSIGYSRMDDRIREASIGRPAATRLGWILVLFVVYAGKCIFDIRSARKS